MTEARVGRRASSCQPCLQQPSKWPVLRSLFSHHARYARQTRPLADAEHAMSQRPARPSYPGMAAATRHSRSARSTCAQPPMASCTTSVRLRFVQAPLNAISVTCTPDRSAWTATPLPVAALRLPAHHVPRGHDRQQQAAVFLEGLVTGGVQQEAAVHPALHTAPGSASWAEQVCPQRGQAPTTAQAATESYMAMPASARASPAAQMATARSEPPDSMIRQSTSTTALGKLEQMTAAVQALWSSPAWLLAWSAWQRPY